MRSILRTYDKSVRNEQTKLKAALTANLLIVILEILAFSHSIPVYGLLYGRQQSAFPDCISGFFRFSRTRAPKREGQRSRSLQNAPLSDNLLPYRDVSCGDVRFCPDDR